VDEKLVRMRVVELAETLAATASPTYTRASQGTYQSEPVFSNKSLEDILDHVRLQTKYLMFDLEATRRENRYLRQMLERRSSPGEGGEQQ
jgi:hypothetical protein